MSDTTNQIPAHERFGYDVVERALKGVPLKDWENDFARLFWQSLEVHNGGFEQWIGNTGREGVIETLAALERHSLHAVHQITKEATEILKLADWDERDLFFSYLEENITNWPERLRPLDEKYWNEADTFDGVLQTLYRRNTEAGSGGNR
jgi:hypothetical protein